MYRIIFGIIAGILGLVTLCAGVFQPKMHKTLFVYDSQYTIVVPKKEVQVVKNLPTQVNLPQEVKMVKKVENTKVQKPVTIKKEPAKLVVQEKVEVKPAVKQVIKQENPLIGILTEKKEELKETPKILVEEKKTKVNTVHDEKKVQSAPVTQQTVTAEEKARQEVILWNKWRSDLQNKIMSEVKLPIVPEGTIFRFSFEVDKYGKISNVQTWALTPAYTPYAIQYIAPVIRSYQGKDILNFPEGSNRFSTTVEGGWRISRTAKLSTPEDYKDAERIINKD